MRLFNREEDPEDMSRNMKIADNIFGMIIPAAVKITVLICHMTWNLLVLFYNSVNNALKNKNEGPKD